MKKTAIFLMTACLLLSLCACGKDRVDEPAPTQTVQETPNPVFEVKITLDNLYDYFEYREYPVPVKLDNGTISNVQVSYGLALKDGYTSIQRHSDKHREDQYHPNAEILAQGRPDNDMDFRKLQ